MGLRPRIRHLWGEFLPTCSPCGFSPGLQIDAFDKMCATTTLNNKSPAPDTPSTCQGGVSEIFLRLHCIALCCTASFSDTVMCAQLQETVRNCRCSLWLKPYKRCASALSRSDRHHAGIPGQTLRRRANTHVPVRPVTDAVRVHQNIGEHSFFMQSDSNRSIDRSISLFAYLLINLSTIYLSVWDISGNGCTTALLPVWAGIPSICAKQSTVQDPAARV